MQRILKWLGQGEKEQKSSIEVGAGRVELLKKYDMIRTADWKKRGDAHAGRNPKRKVKTFPLSLSASCRSDGKNGTFSEIIDDWKWIFGYSARYKGAIVFIRFSVS